MQPVHSVLDLEWVHRKEAEGPQVRERLRIVPARFGCNTPRVVVLSRVQGRLPRAALLCACALLAAGCAARQASPPTAVEATAPESTEAFALFAHPSCEAEFTVEDAASPLEEIPDAEPKARKVAERSTAAVFIRGSEEIAIVDPVKGELWAKSLGDGAARRLSPERSYSPGPAVREAPQLPPAVTYVRPGTGPFEVVYRTRPL